MPSPLTKFALENLPGLDNGFGAKMFDICMEHAVRDCLDRPDNERARVVTLQVVLKPKQALNPDGSRAGYCDEVLAAIVVPNPSLPKSHTRPYSLRAKETGSLFFNPDSLENVNQSTIDFDTDEA